MKKQRSGDLKKRKKERGVILVVAIMVAAFMLILLAPFLFRLSANYRITEKSYDSISALNLAEAGVEKAIWELNYGDISTWSGDSSLRTTSIPSFQTPEGKDLGEITITIANPDGNSPIIEATGRVPFIGSQTIEKKVRVILARDIEPLFNLGIFAHEGFDMYGNGYTDSYSSENGPYGGLSVGNFGDIGTNAIGTGVAQLYNNIEINGRAFSGFGSIASQAIQLHNSAKITSGMDTLNEVKALPDYLPPTNLPLMGDFYASQGVPVTITESAEYSSFTIGGNASVTIDGDVTLYVEGNFLMNSNSKLDISEDSEVEIILGNGFFMQSSNSSINNLSQDPKSLAIFGTPDFKDMTWRSNSQFYGVIYAPKAYIDFSANCDFLGSVICDYLHVSSHVAIHYDESLGKWNKYGKEGDTFSIQSWQEIR